MTDKTRKMYDAYAAAHPEFGQAVSTLAQAIYTQVTQKINLPYTELSRLFITSTLYDRNIRNEPFGKKFTELTGLDRFGILTKESLTEDEFEQHGDAMMEIQNKLDSIQVDDADIMEEEARWAAAGMGKAVKQNFLNYLMTAPVEAEGTTTATPLELLTSSINDVVAFSMTSPPHDEAEVFAAELGISDVFEGLRLNATQSPQHQFDNLVSDVADIMVAQIMARVDELHAKRDRSPTLPGDRTPR